MVPILIDEHGNTYNNQGSQKLIRYIPEGINIESKDIHLGSDLKMHAQSSCELLLQVEDFLLRVSNTHY